MYLNIANHAFTKLRSPPNTPETCLSLRAYERTYLTLYNFDRGSALVSGRPWGYTVPNNEVSSRLKLMLVERGLILFMDLARYRCSEVGERSALITRGLDTCRPGQLISSSVSLQQFRLTENIIQKVVIRRDLVGLFLPLKK